MSLLTTIASWGITQSLAIQVANILSKFGAGSHVYLPGIGIISGLTAGNHLESWGATGATVGNPVGFVLDATNNQLGVEKIGIGSIALVGSATVATYNSSSGVGTVSMVDIANQSYVGFNGLSSDHHKLIISCTSGTSIQIRRGGYSGSVVAIIPLGQEVPVYVSPGAGALSITSSSGTAGFTLTSIKSITGVHVSQASTPSKPILRLTGDIYSWQFDGTDSLVTSVPPFQVTDDHCIIVGASISTVTSSPGILVGGTNGVTRVAGLSVDGTGNIICHYANNVGTSFQTTIGTATANTPFIATIRKIGSSVDGRKNSGTFSTPITPTGSFSVTQMILGNSYGPHNPLSGHMYPAIIIKGTVSDADLSILEKFVGQLSGVSI